TPSAPSNVFDGAATPPVPGGEYAIQAFRTQTRRRPSLSLGEPHGRNDAMKKTSRLLLLILLAAAPATAQKAERINPAGLSKPAPGTYTHIVKVGKTLYIAGQTGVNAE